MAMGKLYRIPLSKEMTVEELDRVEEKRMAAKVCFGCSMRHIFKPEDELCELDEDGQPFRSFHVNCAPKEARATEFQFLLAGRSPEDAKKLADKANNRHFAMMNDLTKEVNVKPVNQFAEQAKEEIEKELGKLKAMGIDAEVKVTEEVNG